MKKPKIPFSKTKCTADIKAIKKEEAKSQQAYAKGRDHSYNALELTYELFKEVIKPQKRMPFFKYVIEEFGDGTFIEANQDNSFTKPDDKHTKLGSGLNDRMMQLVVDVAFFKSKKDAQRLPNKSGRSTKKLVLLWAIENDADVKKAGGIKNWIKAQSCVKDGKTINRITAIRHLQHIAKNPQSSSKASSPITPTQAPAQQPPTFSPPVAGTRPQTPQAPTQTPPAQPVQPTAPKAKPSSSQFVEIPTYDKILKQASTLGAKEMVILVKLDKKPVLKKHELDPQKVTKINKTAGW